MLFSSQPAMRPLPVRCLSKFGLPKSGLLLACFATTAGAFWWANQEFSPRASLLPVADSPPVPKAQITSIPTPQTAAKPPVAVIPAPPEVKGKIIRVGLSTKGDAIQLWSRQPLIIRDAAQPTLALLVPAKSKISIRKSAPAKKPISGKANAFYSGALQVSTPAGISSAWQSALIYTVPDANNSNADDNAPDKFIRLTSNGDNSQWGRPYRGLMEISPLNKPLDTVHYQGALRVVNVVEMEEYLKGVVPWEMTPTAPLEALKAQAICARSELLAKALSKRFHPYGFDVTDYDNCQGYPGAENEKPASTLAVEQTRGQVLFYKGRIADAVYGTNSGGITASDDDVWKGAATPYLRGVRDFSPKLHSTMAGVVKTKMSEDDWAAYCAQNLPAYAQPNTVERRQLASRRATSRRVSQLFQDNDLPEFYRWSRFISTEEMAKAMAANFKIKMAQATEIRVLERTSSGHIKKLSVSGYENVAKIGAPVGQPAQPVAINQPAINNSPLKTVVLQGDAQIRSMLSGRMGSTTALPSSTFVALPQKDATGTVVGWIIKGAGWGHGVGLCQRGAQNHALEGWDYKRILLHYFTGVEIRKL